MKKKEGLLISVIMLLFASALCARENPEHSMKIDPILKSFPAKTLRLAPLTQQQWQQDVERLLNKIKLLHPNPWRTITEKKFKDNLQVIVKQSVKVSRHHTILALIKAVANISAAGQDGQTGIWPFQANTNFHLLPLQLYWFSDGIYIVQADEAHQDWVGRRITAIAGMPILKVIEKVKSYVSHENPIWQKSWTPLFTLIPELLEVLSISNGFSIKVETLAKDGKIRSAELVPVTAKIYAKTFPNALNIAVLPAAKKAPLYLKNILEQDFWFKQLDDTTLYLQYNRVVYEDNHGQVFSDFMHRLEVEIKTYQLTSLIVDIRNNGGGDNTAYEPFLAMLNAFKRKKTTLDLYVLTGRVTFAAAINLAVDLANKSTAVFIGEATGGSPNQFSAPETIQLPNSGIAVRIASRFLIKTLTKENLLTKKPNFNVALSSADYFANRDPVLQKTLNLIELKAFE